MKILLLGGTGQVGRELRRTLLPLGNVVAPTRAQADLGKLDTLPTLLQDTAPDMIVNAAAYTAVDQAQSDPATALRINAAAVSVLAGYARQHGVWLVHYSTDYVFDGTKGQPYSEDDTPHPLNEYGRSKLAGESAIVASGCRALVLRTSWVYSAHGHNFVKTMLRLAHERDILRVVNDQLGTPTSAELLADVTALALAAQRQERLKDGIYHLCAAGSTSRHGLAYRVIELARQYGTRPRLAPEAIQAIASADYPTPAPRPHDTRLDSMRLSQALDLQLPHWDVHLQRAVASLACADMPAA